jgi:hypothetical protein
MHTPFFPAFRTRLAALGRHSATQLRQTTLQQLARHLADLLPAHLLSTADEGANSRDRLYTLRLTCECFLWQMLKPNTACREVVRQVQALACCSGWGPVDEGTSAYIQARQRLPLERLKAVLAATARAAQLRAASPTGLLGRSVKVVDGSSVSLSSTLRPEARLWFPGAQVGGALLPGQRRLA